MNNEFRKQMKEEFIPAIENMIEKERIHLAMLNQMPVKTNWHHEAIFQSNSFKIHLEMRLKQYKEYTETI